jgi:hypothetical protein
MFRNRNDDWHIVILNPRYEDERSNFIKRLFSAAAEKSGDLKSHIIVNRRLLISKGEREKELING